MKKILILFYFFTSILFSQSFQFNYSFGNFDEASSFYISPSGFIYVTDAGSSEIFKLDTLGNTLDYIGGYGWNEGAFDEPVDVYATSLNVFVSDKNNHRVQQFDKDLNFIAQFSTRNSDNADAQFGYPLSSVTSNQGDLYILDSENDRVVKFDMFGNFIQNFGGYDWGDYSLNDPVKLAVSPNNNIFVLDGFRIVVFDQYGNGINIIETNKDLVSINILFNNLTLNTTDLIMLAIMKAPTFKLNEVQLKNTDPLKIVSSIIFNKSLYILTDSEILVFKPAI